MADKWVEKGTGLFDVIGLKQAEFSTNYRDEQKIAIGVPGRKLASELAGTFLSTGVWDAIRIEEKKEPGVWVEDEEVATDESNS